MKKDDIIINIKNNLIVTFKGWVAGNVSTYEIALDNQKEEFTGTVEELLNHCSKKVSGYNKSCINTGGTLL